MGQRGGIVNELRDNLANILQTCVRGGDQGERERGERVGVRGRPREEVRCE